MKGDNGNGGLFRHIRRPTKKEALKAIKELVSKGILTPMTRKELYSVMRSDHDLTQQEKDSIMRFEEGNTSYRTANKPLTDYVMDWSDLDEYSVS